MSKEQSKSIFTPDHLKSYAATFSGGYISGVLGELVTLYQNDALDPEHITSYTLRDNSLVSGFQQVSKEITKNTIKLMPGGAEFAKKHPFIFGASTGFPMWAMTRMLATPLNNGRKGKADMTGYWTSVRNEMFYHTIKNGLDEWSGVWITPALVGTTNNFWAQRCIEGCISAAVASGTYYLHHPIKKIFTDQKLEEVHKIAGRSIPKVWVKKVSYTLARPKAALLINNSIK